MEQEKLYVVLSRDNRSYIYCTHDKQKSESEKEKQISNEEMGGGRPSVWIVETKIK